MPPMNEVNLQADTLIHTFILVKCNIYDEVCHKCFFNTICMVYLMHREGKIQLLYGYLYSSFCLISSPPIISFGAPTDSLLSSLNWQFFGWFINFHWCWQQHVMH